MRKSSLEHRKIKKCTTSQGILLQNTETKLLASTPLTISKMGNSDFEGSEARKCCKVCKFRFLSLATLSSPRSFKKQLCTSKLVPKCDPTAKASFFLPPGPPNHRFSTPWTLQKHTTSHYLLQRKRNMSRISSSLRLRLSLSLSL